MAAQEMYDYLSTITPDYTTTTLSISAQGQVSEVSSKPQVVHVGTDGSEERISFNTSSIFYVSWDYNVLTASDSGTIFDFYNDSAKANAKQRSFYFAHGDGHTYVVRFDMDLTRRGQHVSRYGLPGVRLKVLGRKADS